MSDSPSVRARFTCDKCGKRPNVLKRAEHELECNGVNFLELSLREIQSQQVNVVPNSNLPSFVCAVATLRRSAHEAFCAEAAHIEAHAPSNAVSAHASTYTSTPFFAQNQRSLGLNATLLAAFARNQRMSIIFIL
jgi:hypothetical protein